MPTYDYACEKCGHEFEFFQSMKDDALAACPKEACAKKRWGKGKVKRAIGIGAGIIFKGSGFYQTDYRSDSYKQGAEADKKAKSEMKSTSESSESTGAKANSKADSKADSKAEKSPPKTSD